MANIYVSIPSQIPIAPIHVQNGFSYGYDSLTRAQDSIGQWNPNNANRIDQYGNKVALSQEIDKAFEGSELQYITCLGYPAPKPIDDKTVIMLVCKTALTTDQQNTLNAVIAAHETNTIGDKYGIKKADGTYAMDEAIPTQLDLFDTVDEDGFVFLC